jgi:hypothetical protein
MISANRDAVRTRARRRADRGVPSGGPSDQSVISHLHRGPRTSIASADRVSAVAEEQAKNVTG